MQISVGDVISWKRVGKVARSEGMNGKVVFGTVDKVHEDRVSVKPHYETMASLAAVYNEDILSVRSNDIRDPKEAGGPFPIV